MNKKIITTASLAGVLAVLLIFIDQITKYLAIHNLKGQGMISVLGEVLCLRYVENTGAAEEEEKEPAPQYVIDGIDKGSNEFHDKFL